jgi:Zn finger protein HypA/HybF involved in hydrogenase expression
MLGGGLANHATYAAWPVTCRVCAAITTANFKQLPLVCERCESRDVIPLTEPQVWKGDGNLIETWRMVWGSTAGPLIPSSAQMRLNSTHLTLTDGHYRCPKCGEFELRFGTNAGGHRKVDWD